MSARPIERFLSGDSGEELHAVLRRVREETPVLDLGGGIWCLSRYADCHAALRDPRLSSDPRNAAGGPPPPAGATELMVFNDPPDHTRLRGLVRQAFTPRRVEELRAHVAAIARELIAGGDGGLEVVGDLAYPLPFVVIAELLGIPPADREAFRGWSRDLSLSLEPVVTPEAEQRIAAAAVAIGGYIRPQFAARRAKPRDDLLTALVQAEQEGDRLSDPELGANVVQLLIAGHETTQNLIGNGLLALLRHPEQLERLRGDRDLLPSAVEELLRYESPIQFALRFPLDDVELGGRAIPRGARILLLLGAANRDPERFPDPDALDVGREDRGHLAFGGGPHFCLGNALARLEAEEALGALLDLPGLRLSGDGPPAWRTTVMFRGLEALPVRF